MHSETQTCQPELLDALLKNELAPRHEHSLTLHLSHCQSCRRKLDRLAADATSWSEALEFLQPPDDASHTEFVTDQATQHSPQIQTVIETLAPTDDPRMLGRLGMYEVSGIIGTGAMGVVMKGFDASLNRTVAIKVMAPHLASSTAARKRFAREARAIAAVLHPNVMAIHSVSKDGALPYLVMPYVGGTSLQKRIDEVGPLTTEEVLRIGAQIAAGLAAAHAQGIVHRDIKPSNVLLEEAVDRVAITDFGLARAIDDATMTRSGIIAGTPQYMSPEQARGECIDHRCDLFSLGTVLYAMCTGRPPFRAETTFGVLRRITDDVPRPIREINPSVPDWLCAIVERLLEKNASDRIQSASEVAELLEACLAHIQQPTMVPFPKRLPLGTHFKRSGTTRRRIVAAIFGLLVVAMGVLISLDLSKGRLIIHSEGDNIPIRIVRGNQVVERLTVNRDGAGVRVFAGRYVVEIDGDVNGMTVQNGSVTLKRRGEHTVSITEEIASDQTSTNHHPRVATIDPEAETVGKPVTEPINMDPSSTGPPPRRGESSTMTAAQAVRQGNELTRRRQQVTVRFTVRGAFFQTKVNPDGGETKWLALKSKPGSDYMDHDSLYIYLSPEVAGAYKLGPSDYVGQTVEVQGRVTGMLKRGGLKVATFKKPERWVYSIQVRRPDQFRMTRTETEPNTADDLTDEGHELLSADETLRRGPELSASGQPVRVRFDIRGAYSVFESDRLSSTLILTSREGKQGHEHADAKSLHVWLPENIRSAFERRDHEFIGQTAEIEGVVVYTGAGPAWGPDLYSIKISSVDQFRLVGPETDADTTSLDEPEVIEADANNIEPVDPHMDPASPPGKRGDPIRVQFQVKSVHRSETPEDGKTSWILSSRLPTDAFRSEEFSVIVDSKAPATTSDEALIARYAGQIVRVTGTLKTTITEIYGEPELQRWYHIHADSLDAVRVSGKEQRGANDELKVLAPNAPRIDPE